MEQLAKDFVSKYPSFGDPRRPGRGWEMWFFNSAHGAGATGFLEDRLKNQRKKLASAKKVPANTSYNNDTIDWDSENEDFKLLNNFIIRVIKLQFFYKCYQLIPSQTKGFWNISGIMLGNMM